MHIQSYSFVWNICYVEYGNYIIFQRVVSKRVLLFCVIFKDLNLPFLLHLLSYKVLLNTEYLLLW